MCRWDATVWMINGVKFDYQSRDVDPLPGETGPQLVYEPIILLRVIGPSRAYFIPGLLDTGAAETLIPISFQNRLGVSRSSRFNLRSASGSPIPAWLGMVDLELGDDDATYRWSTRVAFTPARTTAIWGHAGFLKFFTSTFNGRRRTVSLQPNNTFTQPIYADLVL